MVKLKASESKPKTYQELQIQQRSAQAVGQEAGCPAHSQLHATQSICQLSHLEGENKYPTSFMGGCTRQLQVIQGLLIRCPSREAFLLAWTKAFGHADGGRGEYSAGSPAYNALLQLADLCCHHVSCPNDNHQRLLPLS